MGVTLNTKPHDALAFVSLIFDPGDIVETRLIDRTEAGRPAPSRWCKASEYDSLLPELQTLNDDGYDVFVGVNPRPAKGQRGDNCIKLARNLFVDFDGGLSLAECQQRCEVYGLPDPTAIIFSGHGWHLYWRLAEIITDLEQFTRCQIALIQALDSDPVIKNPERIMRVPGFSNNKNPDAIIRSSLFGGDSERVVELCDILDRLPLADDTPLEPDAEKIAKAEAAYVARTAASRNGSTSVIQAYNDAHDIDRTLLSLGFTPTGQAGRYKRPGKTHAGYSVIVRGQRSFHFSSEDQFNDQHFNGMAVHDAFDLFRMSQHKGDFKDAVKDAAKILGLSAPAPTPSHHVAQQQAERKAIEAAEVASVDAYTPFPVDQLPPVLAEYGRQAERVFQADAAFVVLPLLSSIGLAIGNSAIILLRRGYAQPPLLWTGVVADSGAGKSPMFNAALAFLRKMQTTLADTYQRELAEYDAALAKFEAIKKKDRTEDDKPPERPVLQHVLVSDATCEALAVRLATNPRGLISAQDELAAFFNSFNSYKAGGRDMETYLSMYDAGYAKIDRKTAEAKTLIVPRAFVAITGGTQPKILAEHLNSANVDSGLLGRFLFCMPPVRRKTWTKDEITEVAEEAVRRVFMGLFSLPLKRDGTDVTPAVLPLTDAAEQLWGDWYGEVEDEIHAHAESPYRIALPKLRSVAARLALIFQLVSHVSEAQVFGNCIDQTSMARGIAVTRWFMQEQKRVYAMLGMTQEQRALAAQREAIEKLGGQVTVRDWQAKRFRTSQDAESDLEKLVTAGIGEWFHPQPAKTGGRPSKVLRLRNKTPDSESETGVR